MNFVKVCPSSELWSGEIKAVVVQQHPVVLVNNHGHITAYEDRCCHVGVPMSQGKLANGKLVCWAHGWEYDADTGCGINPETARLRSYPARIEHNAIWVDVESRRSDDQ